MPRLVEDYSSGTDGIRPYVVGQPTEEGRAKAQAAADAWNAEMERRYPDGGGFGSFLKKFLPIVAPVLGAMIPGLAPMLGAALGGGGASLATGGNLREALFAGASGALGNVLGGGISGALGGSGSLSGAFTPNAGSIFGGAGGSAAGGAATSAGLGGLGGAAGAALGNTVAPIVVTAPITSGLGSAVGSALGGLAPSVVSGGGSPSLTMGSGNFSQPLTGQTGPVGQAPDTLPTRTLTMGNGVFGPPVGGAVDAVLDPVTVTANTSPDIMPPVTGLYDVPGLQSTEFSSLNNSRFANQQTGQTVDSGGDTFLQDLLGETIGGVAGDVVTLQLADLAGLLPKGDLSTLPTGWDDATNPGPKTGTIVDAYMPNPTDGGGEPAPTPQAPPVANDATGGGLAAGASGAAGAGLASGVGPSSAAPSSATVSPDVDVEGGFSPDIYPWRKARL